MRKKICYQCQETLESPIFYTANVKDEDGIEMGVFAFCGRSCIMDYYHDIGKNPFGFIEKTKFSWR